MPTNKLIVDYALNFLLCNCDEEVEQDLGITEEELEKRLHLIREATHFLNEAETRD